jgi:hypothetical protein
LRCKNFWLKGHQGFGFEISQKLWLMGAQRLVFEVQREILARFLFLIGIFLSNPQKMTTTNRKKYNE